MDRTRSRNEVSMADNFIRGGGDVDAESDEEPSTYDGIADDKMYTQLDNYCYNIGQCNS